MPSEDCRITGHRGRPAAGSIRVCHEGGLMGQIAGCAQRQPVATRLLHRRVLTPYILPVDVQQLARIINEQVYVSAVSADRRSQDPFPCVLKDQRFWVALQLYREVVLGIHVAVVNDLYFGDRLRRSAD